MSESSFTLRDVIQKILPTVMGLTLFVPFFSGLRAIATTEALIFAGVVLSYLIASPVRSLAERTVELFYKTRFNSYRNRRNWVSQNWNYYRLQACLTKDENDYIDELSSPIVFYRVICFYLLIYLGVNTVKLLAAFDYSLTYLKEIRIGQHWREIWWTAWSVQTPMMGNWSLHTIVILAVCPFLIISALNETLKSYSLVFLENGQYDILADKYHREKGNIAIRLWGQVVNEKSLEAVPGVEVILQKNGANVESVKTNERGYFQFDSPFNEVVAQGYSVVINEPLKKISGPTTYKGFSAFKFHLSQSTAAVKVEPPGRLSWMGKLASDLRQKLATRLAQLIPKPKKTVEKTSPPPTAEVANREQSAPLDSSSDHRT